MTEDGLFTGTPQQDYFQVPVDFQLTDHSNIAITKTLQFTSGVASVSDSQDSKINFRVYPNPTNGLFYVEFDLKINLI